MFMSGGAFTFAENPIIWFLIQDIQVHIFEQNCVTCMTLIDLSYVQENSIKLF